MIQNPIIKDAKYICIATAVRKRKTPKLSDSTNIVQVLNVGDVAGYATGNLINNEGVLWVEFKPDPYMDIPTYMSLEFVKAKDENPVKEGDGNTVTDTGTPTGTGTNTDGSYLVDVPSIQAQDNSMKNIFIGLIVVVVGLMGFALLKK